MLNAALRCAAERGSRLLDEALKGRRIVYREVGQDFAVEGQLPKNLKLKLKYQGKKSVIEGLRRVSTPGLRRYVGSTDIPRVRGGLGVAVLSTSEGLMTGNQARKKNLGGELLCYVW